MGELSFGGDECEPSRPLDAAGWNESLHVLRDEWELVHRAGAGDGEAWRRLVAEHLSAVWGAATALGLAEPQAAATSELAWLRLSQGPPRAAVSVRTWLLQVVAEEAGRVARQRPPEQRPPEQRAAVDPSTDRTIDITRPPSRI